MIPYLKPALIVVSVVGVAAGSWMVRGWFEDSKALAAAEVQIALATEIRADMGKIVRTVEDRLQSLKANERIIDRGIIREIERPVYRNVCIPPDGDAFRLLHSIANGEAPGKPDDQGAKDSTPTD